MIQSTEFYAPKFSLGLPTPMKLCHPVPARPVQLYPAYPSQVPQDETCCQHCCHVQMRMDLYKHECCHIFRSEGSLEVGWSVTHSLTQSVTFCNIMPLHKKQWKSNIIKHGEIEIMTLHSYKSAI